MIGLKNTLTAAHACSWVKHIKGQEGLLMRQSVNQHSCLILQLQPGKNDNLNYLIRMEHPRQNKILVSSLIQNLEGEVAWIKGLCLDSSFIAIEASFGVEEFVSEFGAAGSCPFSQQFRGSSGDRGKAKARSYRSS
ncbi:unnamed protein product [Lactuca saligna]|uniref:Uncharacterized protein n=1 Tax=Lactuca saligna TaxID=75948 RepID=A0AA35UMU1_LACSI|nr:unnamed protein product [Lactuca saligna]